MKAKILVACVAALVPAGSMAAPPAAAVAKPDPSDMLLAARTRIDRAGRIVVPVFIDGKGPFRFLVDTGANGSMISSVLVGALGLTSNPADEERVQGTTGIERLPCVTIDDLRISSIVKHDIRMPVSPSPVMDGLGGILGMAGFGPVRVLVDFRRNRVEIDRSNDVLVEGYLGVQAERTPGGLLMIPALVGDVPVEAVIDTGAAMTMGNAALHEALLRSAARHPSQAKIYGVTRQTSEGSISLSPWITFGPVVIQGVGIVYSDIPIFKIWHLSSQPALIIGMNVLGSVDALILDYPRARVYLRPVETSVSIDLDRQMSYIKHGLNDDGS